MSEWEVMIHPPTVKEKSESCPRCNRRGFLLFAVVKRKAVELSPNMELELDGLEHFKFPCHHCWRGEEWFRKQIRQRVR